MPPLSLINTILVSFPALHQYIFHTLACFFKNELPTLSLFCLGGGACCFDFAKPWALVQICISSLLPSGIMARTGLCHIPSFPLSHIPSSTSPLSLCIFSFNPLWRTDEVLSVYVLLICQRLTSSSYPWPGLGKWQSLSLIQVPMLTVCAESISHSCLLLDV